MRAVLIDPFACKVHDVFLPDPGDPWELLESIYIVLSHPPAIRVRDLDGVHLGNTDFLLVDGHGLLKASPRWFRLQGLHFETLAGKGLVVGRNPDSTETDTSYTVADLDYRAVFLEMTGDGQHLRQVRQPWSPR